MAWVAWVLQEEERKVMRFCCLHRVSVQECRHTACQCSFARAQACWCRLLAGLVKHLALIAFQDGSCISCLAFVNCRFCVADCELVLTSLQGCRSRHCAALQDGWGHDAAGKQFRLTCALQNPPATHRAICSVFKTGSCCAAAPSVQCVLGSPLAAFVVT